MEEISILAIPNLHISDLILSCGTIIQLGVLDFSRYGLKGEELDILKITNATNVLPQENLSLIHISEPTRRS